MSDRAFIADLAGFNAEVVRPRTYNVGGTGIGTSAIRCERTGEPLLAITIRHSDGDLLTAILDEAKVFRLAEMMADFVDALPAIQSEARH